MSMSPLWRIFSCGHSFHVQCNLPNVSECCICKEHLKHRIEILAAKANSSVVRSNSDEEIDATNDDDEVPEEEESDDPNDWVTEDINDGETEDRDLAALVNVLCQWPRAAPPRC